MRDPAENGITEASQNRATVMLERLTEPSDLVHADEGAAERDEGEVDVLASLVAHGQATQARQPGVCAFHHPAVPAQALTAIHAAPGNAGLDAPPATVPAAAAEVVSLVGVQLVRPASRSATLARAHRRDGVERGGKLGAVVPVGPAQNDAERGAARVRDDVPFGARLAAIRGIWARRRSPFFAGTEALSSAARLQSICPAPSRRSSSTRCKADHTPAWCQSRNRRQQVMPDPHPISAGRYSHGSPVLSTNRMPVSAARSCTNGRPPRG